MPKKIVIGKPPLGTQTHHVLVGRMTSGDVVIQTDNGWVTVGKEHVTEVSTALVEIVEGLKR